jgi:hypothetical protein
MPDTPGKRQRREVKAKRRQAKDERRAARSVRRDPTAETTGETALDERGDAVIEAPIDDLEPSSDSGEVS